MDLAQEISIIRKRFVIKIGGKHNFANTLYWQAKRTVLEQIFQTALQSQMFLWLTPVPSEINN